MQDYLKDGKPAAKDDPPEYVVDGKYVRPLVDYGVVFDDERENRMLLADAIEADAEGQATRRDALVEARTRTKRARGTSPRPRRS